MKNKKAFMQAGIIIVYILLVWTIVIPLLVTYLLYRYLFGKRCDKTEAILTASDYPELDCAAFKVESGKNRLACFEYRDREKCEGKAVVLVCHGIGCSHGNYLNRIAYFAHKGYIVVGFDITGCGDSEGESMVGLPQSHVDIHAVLTYMENSPEYGSLPILLYGHSWSGFGTAAALNYGHKPAAVVSASGFNKERSIVRFQAVKMCGSLGALTLPWIAVIERFIFGKNAKYTAVEGINAYGGPVLIAHSKDDPTVPYDCSIAAAEGIENKNARILVYEDRGHTLSRPVAAEDVIKADIVGKPRRKLRKDECYFKYEVDVHYHYSKKEVVFATDEGFMDKAEEFFRAALSK